jgi:hypothetical protein
MVLFRSGDRNRQSLNQIRFERREAVLDFGDRVAGERQFASHYR